MCYLLFYQCTIDDERDYNESPCGLTVRIHCIAVIYKTIVLYDGMIIHHIKARLNLLRHRVGLPISCCSDREWLLE